MKSNGKFKLNEKWSSLTGYLRCTCCGFARLCVVYKPKTNCYCYTSKCSNYDKYRGRQ